MSDTLTAIKNLGEIVTKKLGEHDNRLKKVEETPAVRPELIYAAAKGGAISTEEGRFGLKSFGHFLHEVQRSAIDGRTSDTLQKAYSSDIVRKAATGMGELIGSDGGFLVPPEFSNKIMERVYENDLFSRLDKYSVSGNSLTFPRNAESSRANGSRSGGVRAYWAGEGDTLTASKPKFGTLALKLHKLICLGYATDELLEDASTALESYLTRCFSDEINFVLGDSVINGSGAGMPLGVLNAGCTVSVAKESGQAAATLNTQNIVKMWSRMWAPSRMNAAWFINQDIEPSLHTMTLGVGTAGVVTYMPPGGLSTAPYATLMGRPVVPTEFNATLGTVGDIILADLSQWVAISKGAPQTATSMHVQFVTDQMTFKTTFRVDAQPWWATALTPYKGGSNTQSCAVTLATRS